MKGVPSVTKEANRFSEIISMKSLSLARYDSMYLLGKLNSSTLITDFGRKNHLGLMEKQEITQGC